MKKSVFFLGVICVCVSSDCNRTAEMPAWRRYSFTNNNTTFTSYHLHYNHVFFFLCEWANWSFFAVDERTLDHHSLHTHAHCLPDLPPFHTTDQYKLDKGSILSARARFHTPTQCARVHVCAHVNTHKHLWHVGLKMAETLRWELGCGVQSYACGEVRKACVLHLFFLLQVTWIAFRMRKNTNTS